MELIMISNERTNNTTIGTHSEQTDSIEQLVQKGTKGYTNTSNTETETVNKGYKYQS